MPSSQLPQEYAKIDSEKVGNIPTLGEQVSNLAALLPNEVEDKVKSVIARLTNIQATLTGDPSELVGIEVKRAVEKNPTASLSNQLTSVIDNTKYIASLLCEVENLINGIEQSL